MFAASTLMCVFKYMNLTATGTLLLLCTEAAKMFQNSGKASISPEKNGISIEGKLYELEKMRHVDARGKFEVGFGRRVWNPKGCMLV
ncbi:unnamed protein product [Cylicostephanus goldi]|uniref:Uncharacterized protein n=1 Tax=Cylicostephanus goldi TaxID=71465 RepID=A0A3P7MEF8_CYLGO|nr:unnamed protein product [Cylicostephanus goldi]